MKIGQNGTEGRQYLKSYVKHSNGYLMEELKIAEEAIAASAATGATIATATKSDAAIAKLAIKSASLWKSAEQFYD